MVQINVQAAEPGQTYTAQTYEWDFSAPLPQADYTRQVILTESEEVFEETGCACGTPRAACEAAV